MLLYDSMEPCYIMDKTRVSDGEGGFITTWTEGAEIQAAITLNSAPTQIIAAAQVNAGQYIIITPKNAPLVFHDVIKRVSDGKVFRITADSKDTQTPSMASFQMCQTTAEAWEL